MYLDRGIGKTIAIIVAIAVAVASLGVALFLIKRGEAVISMEKQSSQEYFTVVDILNRTVKIPRNLSRVVAIGPGALRLVAYLNATDLLVGVEEIETSQRVVGRDYAMAFSNIFKKLPIVGAGGPNKPPDPERLRAVKPQLIIMSRTYVDLYSPDRLAEEVNASVLVIDYGMAGYLDVDAIKSALNLLGKVLGREERARKLVEYIDSIVSDLSSRTKDLTAKPKVYVGAISYKGAQPFTATQARFAPLLLLNTPSIVDSVSGKGGYMQIDFEYLMQQQPEFIFIDENNLNTVLNDFAKDSSKYCGLNAFKEGKVFGILPFNYYHTNVATALADAYYMGKVLYPNKFSDVDPISKTDEIFKMFLGKPLYKDFVDGGYPGFVNLSDKFKCG